ncbi:MAG: GNAT family N-acetyltransferase [Acidobacteria bacterium ACB1]|nr:GNAT family N-acetyltransferase [Acidobacteria bacterium ACB1]
MNIRFAKVEDADAIAGFQVAMALETEDRVLDAEVVAGAVRDVFADGMKGFYVVAEDAGEVVGSLMISYEWSDWRRGWWWWIQSVYIKPKARGRHIYSLMYEFVKQKAQDAGNVKGIRLYVETENEHAQRLYEKLGMRRSSYFMYDAEL